LPYYYVSLHLYIMHRDVGVVKETLAGGKSHQRPIERGGGGGGGYTLGNPPQEPRIKDGKASYTNIGVNIASPLSQYQERVGWSDWAPVVSIIDKYHTTHAATDVSWLAREQNARIAVLPCRRMERTI
jgi:hypothetical protein